MAQLEWKTLGSINTLDGTVNLTLPDNWKEIQCVISMANKDDSLIFYTAKDALCPDIIGRSDFKIYENRVHVNNNVLTIHEGVLYINLENKATTVYLKRWDEKALKTETGVAKFSWR